MGLVRIRGTIELAQFWPDGESDADTTKIKVSVDKDSFFFADDGVNFKPTHVYEGAVTHGTGKKLVITNGKVTVRLQGIDAPELHYRAAALPKKGSTVTDAERTKFNGLNVERRQYWGETATVALADHLEPLANNGQIECEALSIVDAPEELVDTYGRIVADIRVGDDSGEDINVWLARAGWVFPTFYSSMKDEEIRTFLDAMKDGQQKKRVWSKLSGDASKFDLSLVFRGEGASVQASKDKGPVLMPKLFRRQVAFRMRKAAGLFKGSFEKYLSQNKDECFLLQDFLSNGVHSAQTRYLHEFVDGDQFTKKPHELVFKEKTSTVVDKNGKRIENF